MREVVKDWMKGRFYDKRKIYVNEVANGILSDRTKLTSEDYKEAAEALIRNAKEYYLF